MATGLEPMLTGYTLMPNPWQTQIGDVYLGPMCMQPPFTTNDVELFLLRNRVTVLEEIVNNLINALNAKSEPNV